MAADFYFVIITSAVVSCTSLKIVVESILINHGGFFLFWPQNAYEKCLLGSEQSHLYILSEC